MASRATLITLFAGSLLSLMVYFNGLLASFIRPLEASLVVYLIGLFAAFLLLFFSRRNRDFKQRSPAFAWSTGIFGGLSVVLVGITVNSPLGVAGTVGLSVLGQILYSWVNDAFGLLGSARRKMTFLDFAQALLILAGVGVMIYG